MPPATLPAYIGVIVSTSIAKQGSTIYGNIAALVVVQVDTSSQYGSDPGHPGYGTIAAVIQDGASLFPHAASRRAPAPVGETSSFTQTGAGEVIAKPVSDQSSAPAAVATGNHRFFLYSPELHLLAESELTTSASPAIITEYIWFADQPVAQSDTTGATSWTSTDHLGTPLLQTSAAQGVTWRAEYEPYGAVFALRSSDQHQPLRLPGQEAEQLSLGANGATDRSYNVYRWYRAGAARYSQPDPVRRSLRAFQYADDTPTLYTDRLGLWPSAFLLPPDVRCCAQATADGLFRVPFANRESGGITICCDGRQVGCANIANIVKVAASSRSAEIIASCIVKHEQQHFPDNPCNNCGLYRPQMLKAVQAVSECAASVAESECLGGSIGQCGGDRACIDDLERRMVRISAYGNSFGHCPL